MNKISKFLSNDWTVTIVSTMLGIIIGLYITNYFEEKKLLKGKESALKQVSKELSDNNTILLDYHKVLKEKHQSFSNVIKVLNQDMELIIHTDSLENFKAQTKSVFAYSSNEPIANGQIKISGDLNLNVESQLLVRDLSHIIWDSYKQTNFLSVTKFKCVTELELVYTLQSDVDSLNKKWKDSIFKGMSFLSDPSQRDDFMALWRLLLEKQNLLLKMYESQNTIMENCY